MIEMVKASKNLILQKSWIFYLWKKNIFLYKLYRLVLHFIQTKMVKNKMQQHTPSTGMELKDKTK
jgi:23S rRNA A1618 N6-methylase RlmF